MFKTLAILSAVASVAHGATSLIPTSNISSGCSAFLTKLNSDTTLSACTSSIVAATKAYAPGGSSSSSATSSALQTSLGSLCASNSACPDSTLRTQIAAFYAACGAELTSSPNEDVIRLYDVLYTLSPFKSAICSKDTSGSYCALNTTQTAAGGSSNAAKASVGTVLVSELSKFLSTAATLSKRADTTATVMPNVTTFQDTAIMFLFVKPSLSSSLLCTSCTRQIMSSYITFESSTAYAPGLANSLLLAGQQALYQGITTTCGASFMSSTVQAAGGISDGIISGAERNVGMVGAGLSAAAAAMVAFMAL